MTPRVASFRERMDAETKDQVPKSWTTFVILALIVHRNEATSGVISGTIVSKNNRSTY